ncbi:6-bladed beta-propeller [Rhodohalobacter sp.]|uniref:6-bladed beta-propeller n=1 Tax=Rhodohalobacter sp. TaxID=1974210 RepID=UPI002ACEE77C|nr:6-bladed beta-propeller [Rhodohalobacter sp.]MDZ7756260.1 6-bladed beta-propeller [Rhodohalobacter sp.]
MKIGAESQGEEYQLGDPVGVRTDSSLNIYVADRASLTIRMFDPDGKFIRDIGRRGRGPSEFLDINTFEITPEENFFVLDRGNWRYKHLTKEGDEVSSVPIDQSGTEW